jgi:hypothetical protein
MPDCYAAYTGRIRSGDSRLQMSAPDERFCVTVPTCADGSPDGYVTMCGDPG